LSFDYYFSLRTQNEHEIHTHTGVRLGYFRILKGEGTHY
jgi:hypothetical protein